MAPLIVLVAITLLARAAGGFGVELLASWPAATAIGLAAMFTLTGASHFAPSRRPGLVAIVPPSIPTPGLMVTITGVLELAGAMALLIPPAEGPWRELAAWMLAALLVAVFPANVHAAGARRSPTAPHTPLPRRSLMQCVYLAALLLVALGS